MRELKVDIRKGKNRYIVAVVWSKYIPLVGIHSSRSWTGR